MLYRKKARHCGAVVAAGWFWTDIEPGRTADWESSFVRWTGGSASLPGRAAGDAATGSGVALVSYGGGAGR